MALATPTRPRPAIVLFAHGSRDPEWAQPFRKIQRMVQARQPGAAVELAFLEIMEPPLAQAVADLIQAGHTHVTVAPLFMAQGAHLKRDLSNILDAIRADNPGMEITLLPAIAEVDAILEAISAWLVGAAAP